uniref:Protein-tyrosine-phosphatase n=1 Tax=Erythrolobus madagascarensis TaxID=708628 RepID=A0A7S0T5S2_9RHOD|mmetsp:Transcript_1422/g.2932  ORF Transcript_1422/g.2932 Transcript_1422/m.2932 type:complete len:251 (+) Transcript_1422:290-1042(+)
MGQWKHERYQDAMQFQVRALEALSEANRRQEENIRRGLLPSRFTPLEHGKLRLLVTDAPTESELTNYAAVLRKHGVKHVVRVCEAESPSAYDAGKLSKLGFVHHQMFFSDGSPPSEDIIRAWLLLLEKVFGASATNNEEHGEECDSEGVTVAVHCLSGLGRASLLAAIALVQYGMDAFDAIGYIRARRRGALNSRQFAFLENYEPLVLHPQQHQQPQSISKRDSVSALKKSGSLRRALSYLGGNRKVAAQ